MKLYAQWDTNTSQVRVDPAGGRNVRLTHATTQYTFSQAQTFTGTTGSTLQITANPERDGYTFNSWVLTVGTNTNDETNVNSAFNAQTRIYTFGETEGAVDTLTATWGANTYTITYYGLEGATVETNPAEYTPETATFTLHNPTKPLYTFTGWSGTDLTGSENMTVTVAQGSWGNREYTAHWKLSTYTVVFEVGSGVTFTTGNGFTTTPYTKTVELGGLYGDADANSKTWPAAPVKTETVEGVTLKAEFISWYIKDTDTPVGSGTRVPELTGGTVTLVPRFNSTAATAFRTAVTTATTINANRYTTEGLNKLDTALKNALKSNTTITDTSDDAITAALADLEANYRLTTDEGSPQLDVYETKASVTAALSSFKEADRTAITNAMANKGDISYVAAPGTMWYTYMMYTNSETPFILIDANDIVGEGGRVAYPLTAERDTQKSTTYLGRTQLLNSTGTVDYNKRLNSTWWKSGAGNAWYHEDTTNAGRNAGYQVLTKTVDNPYASLTYAGKDAGGAQDHDYSYYQHSQYVILTPTFVKDGTRQYALYTFTVKDDTADGERAATSVLKGEAGISQTGAAQNLETKTNAKPDANTISIFVEYCNTMPAEPVGQTGDGTSAGDFLNVYSNFDESDEAVWQQRDWLNRTAGGEVMPKEYAGYQTAGQDGKYSGYVPRSPEYDANSVGSFYKPLAYTGEGNDKAVVDAYWAAYDNAVKSGDKQAARLAASQAASALMKTTIATDMANGTIREQLELTSQAVGADNVGKNKTGCLGQYVAWPTTGSTLWQTQFYATATCREEALVYVHLYDFFGNAYTAVLQRNYQEHIAPTGTYTSVGAVTVVEDGGSGIKQMKVTQYTLNGSGAYAGAIAADVKSANNVFTITGLGKGYGPSNVFSLYVEDNAGHGETIDFCASEEQGGSVTITVVDEVNMDLSRIGNYTAGGDGAEAPMTLLQAEEVTEREITAVETAEAAAAAPEETTGSEYAFTLNEAYTVTLFAVVDCDITLYTNEGGMIKAYLDGEYAPVKQGKITAKSGQEVQIRAAAKAGYELESLVMTYEDGVTVDLMGDYASELLGNVAIRATFRKSDTQLTITVENGKVNGRTEWQVSPYSRVTAAADEAPEGKVFAYWAMNGTPVSYDEVYTFTVTGDTALTAIYSDTEAEKVAAVAMDPASENHLTQVNGAYTLMYSGTITLPEGATLEEFGMVLTDKAAQECTEETLVIGGERTAKLTAEQITAQGQYKMTVNGVRPGATRTGRLFATVTLADGTTTTVYSNTWSELTTPDA